MIRQYQIFFATLFATAQIVIYGDFLAILIEDDLEVLVILEHFFEVQVLSRLPGLLSGVEIAEIIWCPRHVFFNE